MINLSRLEDFDEILMILAEAKRFLKENAINQWQKGYPNYETLLLDFNKKRLYVKRSNNEILGFFVLSDEIESCYQSNFWQNEADYFAIHRIAVKERGKNIASSMLEFCLAQAKLSGKKSLRIDTHENNIPMQKLLEKNDFKYMGIIYLDNIVNEENKRLAYWHLV